MITLKDYIGKIYKEVTNAKVQSDIETLAIAQEYVNNPMLKHFSVPNIRIKDMELTIPVAVDTVNTSSAYTEREVQDVYEAAFEKVYLSFYPFKTARMEAMKGDVSQKAVSIASSAAVELSTVSDSEVAAPTEDTAATPERSDTQTRTTVNAESSQSTYESVNKNYATNFAEATYGLVSSEIEQGAFYAQLVPEIESNLQPKSFTLEELPVIVESSRLKQISDPGSMISIKVNITDDAMEWTTDVDENGNTVQRLDYL